MLRTRTRELRLRIVSLAALCGAASAGPLPATWLAPVSGDWDLGANWSTSPLYPDDTLGGPFHAIIDATGAPYTVLVDSAYDAVVEQLTLNSPDATLRLNASVFNVGAGGATVHEGVVLLAPGWLRGGTWTFLGGQLRLPTNSTGYLDGVQIVGDLVAADSSSRFRLLNGATVTGDYRLEANSADIELLQDHTIHAGQKIILGPAPFGSIGRFAVLDGHTLLIEPGALVRGGGVLYGESSPDSSVITNRGTISADVAGEWLRWINYNGVNEGLLEAVNGGILSAEGVSHTPTSHIRAVGAGSQVSVAGIHSAGLAEAVDGGTLLIYGEPTTAVWETYPIVREGGFLIFSGDLTNNGDTWNIDASTGDIELLGGRVRWGNIQQSGGARLLVRAMESGFPSELYGAKLHGGLDLTYPNARLKLTHNANIFGDITITATGVELFHESPLTLKSGQTLRFEVDDGQSTVGPAPIGGHDLTIEAGAVVCGVGGLLRGGINNFGTIVACGGTGTLVIAYSDVEHHGVIRAEGGATLDFDMAHLPPFHFWTFHEGSQIVGGPGGTVVMRMAVPPSPRGSFVVEIGGPAATDHGVIDFSVPTTLDGSEFTIALVDGYEPTLGDSFEVVTFNPGEITGDLTSMHFPPLSNPGHRWFAEQSASSVVVGVAHAADVDHDGHIGFGDINIVLSNFNAPGSWAEGDVDGDGLVGFADLNAIIGLFNTTP